MKKLLRTIFAITAIAMFATFASCDKNEDNSNQNSNTPSEEQRINAETPRNIIKGSDGNFYVTCYYPRSVVRYNPSEKRVTALCKLGNYQPEGLAEVNGKLYIASGYIQDENYNYLYDNKLYVVDISSFTLVDSVIVGRNPEKVRKLDDNHIVFNTLGDYGNDQGGLWIMDVDTKTPTKMDVTLYNFDVYNGDIYGYTSIYSGDPLGFYKIDGTTHNSTTLGIDWTASDSPYGIGINQFNGDIIITSDGGYTANGDCYVFNSNGTLRNGSIQVGMLPCKIVALSNDNLIILNQGGWGSNNASISKVDISGNSADNSFFDNANSRGLGDVGQDMISDGDNAYITVSFSNSIERMNVNTGKSSRYATTE